MQGHSTNERYRELARKQLQGDITPEESAELAGWLAHDDGRELEVPSLLAESRELHEKRLLRTIEQKIGWRKTARIRTLRRVATAAAILLFAALGWWLLKPSPVSPVTAVAIHENDRPPGGNKATLTLGNGRRIVLDSASNGTLFAQGGIRAIKLDSGSLAYNAGADAGAIQVHTLSTPVGGQFRITLADGTNVWLNAASSLRFPSAFSARERAVEITGEAYFEVTKDAARPFKVSFNGTAVEVLGTHFNVMAYPDESKSKVTLLEGSVAVSNASGRKLLKPGMQAVVGNAITTRQANVEEAVAWKNGLFIFDNEEIHSIMRKLARWYDVRSVYAGDMPGLTFSGTVSRYSNVSGVLEMLEMTESVRFELKGGTIEVLR
ncbi:FecR family protein [Chitinophaga sp. GCM10012297]|uniref:FecR domain-containing protein n=1 Tax=Chitinophaga chungangae TaxID=2821488 RepID=A0ABS3Y9E3_9BACT|nr:FecR family protein [Chitinophaga chungangae]MBO9151303.1 FecR domain-containing protein [Chitinophaga chungangae]